MLWLLPEILKVQNRLLKACYVPATSTSLSRLLFLFYAVAINNANKAKQGRCYMPLSSLYYLDVYGYFTNFTFATTLVVLGSYLCYLLYGGGVINVGNDCPNGLSINPQLFPKHMEERYI